MIGADLIALAERCENAEAADDLLDAEITVALKKATYPDARVYKIGRNPAAGAGPKGGWRKAGIIFQHIRFTASLDAAMTLVPNGYGYYGLCHEGQINHHWRVLTAVDGLYRDSNGSAATPALALCAAALRARASLPAVAPTSNPPAGPTSLHSLGTGAAEATGDRP